MKKLVLPLLGLLFLSGIASAYQVTLTAPDILSVGKPIIVNGTTTNGIGTPIEIVLYYQLTTGIVVDRTTTYVQSDKTFRVVFDTTNLQKGTYKVEVPGDGQGNSITHVIQLIDRTDELQISSPLEQIFNGKLNVAGTLEANQNSGVQIEVTGPDDQRIFGPQYISTNFQGYFSVAVPIDESGDFIVSFTDQKGFIGTKSFTVLENNATTSSSISPAIPTQLELISAHEKASRDIPAYFVVKSGSDKVNVYTSSNIDWVMEYYDDKGILHTVLDRNQQNPEEIKVKSQGNTLYFKIYPFKYSDNGIVFLYAENAQSVNVSPTIPAPFVVEQQTPVETQKSPLPITILIVSLLALIFFKLR
jgi:hypothetical protein